MYDLSEYSGSQEASGDVVLQVSGPEGDAPEGLESAVDDLSWPVWPRARGRMTPDELKRLPRSPVHMHAARPTTVPRTT